MFTCRHNSRLISDQQDRSLSWLERLGLGVHLLGCRSCRRFRRAVRWLRQILAFIPNDVPLPTEARERIWLALERAAREE